MTHQSKHVIWDDGQIPLFGAVSPRVRTGEWVPQPEALKQGFEAIEKGGYRVWNIAVHPADYDAFVKAHESEIQDGELWGAKIHQSTNARAFMVPGMTRLDAHPEDVSEAIKDERWDKEYRLQAALVYLRTDRIDPMTPRRDFFGHLKLL